MLLPTAVWQWWFSVVELMMLLSLVFVLIMVMLTSVQCAIYSGSPSTPAPLCVGCRMQVGLRPPEVICHSMGLRPAISRSCPRTQNADADDGVGTYPHIQVGRKQPLQRPQSPSERRAKGEFPPLYLLAAVMDDGASMTLMPMPCIDQWHTAYAMNTRCCDIQYD